MALALRSISELLASASEADPDAAARLISEAADQAAEFHHWEVIFGALPAALPASSRESLGARALAWVRGLDAASSRERVWGYKTVAVFQSRGLAQPALAFATLHEAEQQLDAAQTPAFLWGVLARGHREAGLDDGDARRVLEAGWAAAWAKRDVEQLCRLVNSHRQLFGRDEALERLQRVDAAAREWGELARMIFWWHAHGEFERGRQVQGEVFARATRFDEVVELARHWQLYEKAPGVEAAFARAEALAKTDQEWLRLAWTSKQSGGDAALTRRALDRAAALATDPEARATLASCALDWFGDEALAARLGPAGVRPDALWPRRQTHLADWDRSASDLLDWLRERMTPAELERVAALGAPRDLAALQAICATGRVAPMGLVDSPGELLRKVGFWPDDKVGPLGRALACALLCITWREDRLDLYGPALVKACLELGGEAPVLAERLLAWRVESRELDSRDALLGQLLLVMLHGRSDPADPRLPAVLRAVKVCGGSGLRELLASPARRARWAPLLEAYLLPLHREPGLSPLLDGLGFLAEPVGAS